jgi:hypothetical protein
MACDNAAKVEQLSYASTLKAIIFGFKHFFHKTIISADSVDFAG